jgi:adenylate cyclase
VTLDELAARTDETVESLRRLVDVGVLASAGADFDAVDVERVRLVQVLRRHGIGPDAVGAALAREADLFVRYLDQVYADGDFPSITLAEAAAQAGVPADVAQRVRDAGGLGAAAELLTGADVEAMRSFGVALGAGFPEAALVQLVRVYADCLNRVGDAEARLFHFYVHEPLRAAGLPEAEVDAMTNAAAEQLITLVEPAVLYFHRRGLARAIRDDLALHLAEAAGLLPPDDETGRLLTVVGFIDLARFTSLTDAMGDAAAIAVLDRFSELVRRRVLAHEGRIVKQIGDAFMLVFSDPTSAVRCALDIRDAAVAEREFLGTRQGLHWGPTLYREGDYYGAAVNLAARIVAEARSDGVLVSGDLRARVGDSADVSFVPAGQRTLKHVAEPVEVHEAVRPGEQVTTGRTVDPVCGMPIDADAATVRLHLGGRDLVFCSHGCLHQFAAHPERYG